MKYTTYPLEASDKMQYAVREWNDNTIRFRIDFERAVDRARLKEAVRTLLEICRSCEARSIWNKRRGSKTGLSATTGLSNAKTSRKPTRCI